MNSLDTSYPESLLQEHDSWARPDLEWVKAITVNKSAVERRVATLAGRRTVKKEWQAAWLLKAITCIDLTTLSGDDTEGKVQRLCAKAKSPVRPDLLEALGVTDITVGAVCVYPTMVAHAVRALRGTNIPVASVATGFPTGLMPMSQRLEEIRYAVDQGAAEIDIVITRELRLPRRCQDRFAWQVLMKEELGRDWLEPALFRFGASGLLTDIERQLEHFVTGRYSASYRHPMA